MESRQIHVFISHSWKYSGHYDTLASWIFDQRWVAGHIDLRFHDYSIPRTHPIHDAPNEALLKQAIYGQIARCHVVVIPTGMYATYSRWIRKEIDGAKLHRKPVLAVNPWSQERKASVVVNAADETAGWRSQSVVGKIWELYSDAR